ncbi:MAG: sigma-70 family RNA polymerase sigma factor [Desulfatitalea sp.]|nr:sigma-70 family RNA polymerase sigma factor [Desulfatitalea sp.]NNK01444.1 sigma-70 family RNA polymerase sigma factor [Desulfatitalea sp.]
MNHNPPRTDYPEDPEQWVDLYGNYMYRYALSRLPDKEIAQDLVQEAFLAAIGSLKRFKGQSTIKTWLIAILKRKIVDYYRRSVTRQINIDEMPTVSGNDTRFNGNGHWRVAPDAWRFNPVAAYEQKEFMDVLYRCMAKLPARLAEIFMLREFEELGTEAICNQMQISESNSWVMLYRARMQLRDCLKTDWLTEHSG